MYIKGIVHMEFQKSSSPSLPEQRSLDGETPPQNPLHTIYTLQSARKQMHGNRENKLAPLAPVLSQSPSA